MEGFDYLENLTGELGSIDFHKLPYNQSTQRQIAVGICSLVLCDDGSLDYAKDAHRALETVIRVAEELDVNLYGFAVTASGLFAPRLAEERKQNLEKAEMN